MQNVASIHFIGKNITNQGAMDVAKVHPHKRIPLA
jgi:hypothetical protein